MKLLGLAFALLLAAAAGFGLAVILTGWVEADWPAVDDTDEAGA